MIKVCFSIKKGGDGKSTSTISFSSYLALNGNRVLVVDLDDQANTTSILLGRPSPVSFENVVRDNCPPSDVIFPSKIENLDILPANSKLVYAEGPLKDGEGGGSGALRDFFADHNLDNNYDYCVIDTPGNLGIITEIALVATDYVVVPVGPAKFSVDGLAALRKKIAQMKKEHNPRIELLGAFFNKYVMNRAHIKGMEKDLREFYGDKLFTSKVRNNASIEQAMLKGKPVFLHSVNSIGAIDFASVCEEIVERIKRPQLPTGAEV